MSSGQTILVTGAGGCIGFALAKALFQSTPRLLILLDRCEHSVHRIQRELTSIPGTPKHVAILGDICDEALLAEIFETYCPEVVYHLAAFKHVSLMETNPIAVIQNNTLGTLALVRAALAYKASTLCMVSTDKAANPRNVMGLSKRVAELALVRWSNARTRMSAVRLVNVFGSPGSVVPLMQKEISNGGPVSVTHSGASRYFMTLTEAVEIIFAAAALQENGSIFVPDPGQPMNILELARTLIRTAARGDIPIAFTGLHSGEKIVEELVSASEFLGPTSDHRLRRAVGPEIFPEEFDADIAILERNVHDRDLPGMLETLRRIVPEYRPSETLLGLLSRLPV